MTDPAADTASTPLPSRDDPRRAAVWADRLGELPLPALTDTARSLQALAANEDAVDAHTIADTIAADPLMTLAALAHVGRQRARDDAVHTLTGALVMLGVPPFFNAFGVLPDSEALLAEEPALHAPFEALLRRARRAADLAAGLAVHRMEPEVEAVREAALLHDFAELLLYCRAPAEALLLARRKHAAPSAPSEALQRACLGCSLAAVRNLLAARWYLPPLLRQLALPPSAATPAVQLVRLAARVARHSNDDWQHPKLQQDVQEVATLLHMDAAGALALLHAIDDR